MRKVFLLAVLALVGAAAWFWRPRPTPPPQTSKDPRYSTGTQLVDALGQPASEPYDYVGDFREGYAPYRQGRYWGFLEAHKPVTLPQFEEAREVHDGLAPVKEGGRWGLADPHGVQRLKPAYDDVGEYSQNLVAVQTQGLWGYLEPPARVILKTRFKSAGPFAEGLAFADGWYIDKTGKRQLGPYDEGRKFSEGLAAVRKGEVWGYIDLRGSFRIPARYLDAAPFSEGLAAVRTPDGSTAIDAEGREAFPPQRGLDLKGTYSDGWIRLEREGKRGFLDRSGTVVWPPREGGR